MNKSELLDKVTAGRAKLDAILSQLTEEQMVQPGLENGWSVKDLIGHLGWWENRATFLYRNLTSGEPIKSLDGQIDEINAQTYAENKARSLAEVRRYEREAYTGLLAVVGKATEDDLFDPKRFAWTQGQHFANWIDLNTVVHYDQHMDTLVNWAKGI